MWKTNTFIYCTVIGLNEREGIELIFFLPPIASDLSIHEKKEQDRMYHIFVFFILYTIMNVCEVSSPCAGTLVAAGQYDYSNTNPSAPKYSAILMILTS
jgi:hypothetical protein